MYQEGTLKNAAACSEGYFKIGGASDSPRARVTVVSLGHLIPIALILIKHRKHFSFSRYGVDYCCFKIK